MTREEAIDILEKYKTESEEDYYVKRAEALDMAIKALEQEPCEDAVSRQALIERINNAEENFKADHMESIASDDGDAFVDGVLSGVFNIREMVAQAPSVTPTTCIAKVTFDKDELKKIVDEKVKEMVVERKKGKWLNNDASGYHFYGKCSECGQEFCVDAWYTQNMKFCPNCGAEMESEE